jgi:hypothetical protein
MNPYWIIAALAAAVQFVLFVRWLYRRMRDDEIQRAFIRDLALNHLPHVYSALRQIAEHEGIVLEEPPLIRYVEIDKQR